MKKEPDSYVPEPLDQVAKRVEGFGFFIAALVFAAMCFYVSNIESQDYCQTHQCTMEETK